MAKKHSVKSFLMMAKYHGKKADKRSKEQTSNTSQVQEVGQDNFGAQTSDERSTAAAAAAAAANHETANSIAGDSSSGYHSVVAIAGHTNGSNQFYPARHQQQQPSRQDHDRLTAKRQARMVNERIPGERSRDMWPVMIDDELGGGGVIVDDETTAQHIGACNKVHLIDDDAIDEVDVDIDSYDIDCVAAAAAASEDNNNISDRFHRHRYCVDANSSPASRFDESFQLERQRHQHQFHTNSSHHHRQQQQQQQQQYFHQQPQSIADYYQQQPSSLHHPSQFQPSHHQQQQQQQPSSLLNGACSQQQRFVNYVSRPTADILGQYPIPPTNYSQQQYHTLVQYQPIVQQQQQHPYSYTDFSTSRKLAHPTSSTDSSGVERSSGASVTSHLSYQSNHQLPSLAPSGATSASKMQPASSRQYLTAANDLHHHHHQQQPHKSSSRRKQLQSSPGGQVRKSNNHYVSSSSSKNKPTLDCCGKMAKFLLFTTNLLFWSAGIALGAWGILSLVEDHKYNLSQLLVFEPNSRMSLFQLLSWSFITLGCATILVGFCGCSAIFKNNRWILGLYIFLVLAIFALDLATGLLAIIFQEKLVANVRLRLANKLRADYGVQASFTAAIDYIQTKFECCGLEGHFDYDQSVWRLQRLGGFEATVARTCCHLRNTFDDQAHINPRPVNESMCQSTDVRFHQSYRYRKGCLDDLERLVRQKIWTFTLGCAAVGGVILISLMFATCFCRSIQAYGSSRKASLPSSSVSSPKHQVENKPARHFTSAAGHQISSSQRHLHQQQQQHK